MSALVAFGAGGDEPYALLLGDGDGGGRLALRKVGDEATAVQLDVADWRAPANAVDVAVLAGLAGPLLDVGCGPGRMVRAAEERGLAALGIDVSTGGGDRGAEGRGSGAAPIGLRATPPRAPLGTVLLSTATSGSAATRCALLLRVPSELLPDGAPSRSRPIRPRDDGRFDLLGSRRRRPRSGQLGASPGPRRRRRHARHAASAGLPVEQVWRIDGRVFARLVRAWPPTPERCALSTQPSLRLEPDVRRAVRRRRAPAGTRARRARRAGRR